MVSAIKRIGFGLLFFLCAQIGVAQGVLPLHINYAESDRAIYGSSFDYASYRLNSTTDSLALGSVFSVCDTFPDLISGNFYSKDFLPALRLDSVRIRMNLNKHSSGNDSLIIGISGTLNGVFPQLTNAYYSDTLIFNTSFAIGNSYASSAYYTIPVGKYVTNSFSTHFIFKAQANDTLNMWSGYGYDGICTEQPGLKKAQPSHFFPNSFAYRKEFAQILPSVNGEDIFYECDTVQGFDTLVDGRNYIQNWDMDFYITATTASIGENVFQDSPLLYPNPGTGTFYMTQTCTQITVISASGRTVWQEVPQGNSVYLPLPAGFYTVRLKTESGTRTQKLIIADK